MFDAPGVLCDNWHCIVLLFASHKAAAARFVLAVAIYGTVQMDDLLNESAVVLRVIGAFIFFHN